MVPQGMYPVTMRGQQRPGPYPPNAQSRPPQQPAYPQQAPPMAPRPQQQNPAPAPKVNPDTMPLSQIDTLSDDRVNEMIDDYSKFEEFVKQLPYVTDYNLRQESLKRLEDEVQSLQRRLSDNPELVARRKELDDKRAAFQEKTAQKQAKESEMNPQSLVDKLDEKAKAADAECEEIAAKFLSGEISAQDFAKEYKDKRFYYHTLSAKKESIFHNM